MSLELLTSAEITKLGDEGHTIQFTGKKLVEMGTGGKASGIWYYVEVNT